MSIKLNKYFLILFVGLFCLLKTQAQTYSITDPGMGQPGSADIILAQAVTAANLGGNVIVNMNAPDLCTVSVIVMQLTSGTITLQKDPLATQDQGFTNGAVIGGQTFLINLSNTASLNFKNFEIRNYDYCMTITGGDKIVVDGVKFLNYNRGAHFFSTYTWWNGNFNGIPANDVLIQNCEFEDSNTGAIQTYVGVLRDNSTNSTVLKNFKILNNNFKCASYRAVILKTEATYDNLKIEIKNNYSTNNSGRFIIGTGNAYQGINFSSNNNTNDYLFDLEFDNNIGVNLLELCAPLNGWKITNNTISGISAINIINPGVPRNYKTGLINHTIPYCNNQTFLNGNNTFLYPTSYPSLHNYHSIQVNGNLGAGCSVTEISDLDVPGCFITSNNVSVRRCKVFSSIIPNFPILHTGSLFPLGTLFPTLVSGGQLTAYYTYSNVTNADNNDLYVDFYKSNPNGDLLDYLGYQFIAAGTLTGYNNVTLPIPSGVSLVQSDRVAMTITGLHPQGSTNVVAVGTSIAFYPIAPCTTPTFISPSPGCIGPVQFVANSTCVHPQTVMWDFGDGSNGSGGYTSHTYNAPGTYNVTLKVTAPWQSTTYTTSNPVTINNCQPPQTCANCIGSFAPDAGEYFLSLWVREDISPLPMSYNNAKVQVSFTGNPTVYTFGTDLAKNKIIDGWQRIDETFAIPSTATHVNINLINNATTGGNDAYFDDIRIVPKDGQMKSYVYDPITFKLSAVLDENNYASFYEYDEEGKLLRIKKETEKGIMTIQENRESLKKR